MVALGAILTNVVPVDYDGTAHTDGNCTDRWVYLGGDVTTATIWDFQMFSDEAARLLAAFEAEPDEEPAKYQPVAARDRAKAAIERRLMRGRWENPVMCRKPTKYELKLNGLRGRR